MKTSDSNKELEINILRLVFLLASIISPVITYLWAYFDASGKNSIYLGWLMALLFLGLLILSYISSMIKKRFFLISFIMFDLACVSSLYHAALNGFDNGYTLLFYLVIFSTTLFIGKLRQIIIFHVFIFIQMIFSICYYKNYSNRIIIVLSVYFVLVCVTVMNAYLLSRKQEKINRLVSLIENINLSYSFNETLQYIYTAFSSFLPYSYIGIALIKDDGESIEASYGISDGTVIGLPKNLFGLEMKLKDTSLKEVIETGNAKIINNLEKYTRNKPMKDYNKIVMEAGIESSISFPLIINNKPVGIIFFSSKNKNVYTNEHIKSLDTLTNSISISFEKCILLEELIYNNIMSLVKLAELRDSTTGDHLDRMKKYTRILAQLLFEDSNYKNQLSSQFANDIEKFAPMHDIGKVGIRDGILLKPGKLTKDEYEEMKKHVLYGAKVVRQAEDISLRNNRSLFKMGIEIIEGHHEKWDGSGYPYGKRGEEIPLSARIVALADVFDALTSKRPYKEPYSFETSFNIILEGSGKHFDPEIVRVFEQNITKILEIYNMDCI